jgi:hypothetical protein
MPEYEDAIMSARDLIDDFAETHPEYVRGMVNILAEMFSVIDLDTGTRMEQVERDIRNAPRYWEAAR